jgi:cell division protein FtsL
MIEDSRPKRFRFRLRTILLVVAIVALSLVVVIQQVHIARMREQIGRMERSIDADVKARDQLSTIIRELRDKVDRKR